MLVSPCGRRCEGPVHGALLCSWVPSLPLGRCSDPRAVGRLAPSSRLGPSPTAEDDLLCDHCTTERPCAGWFRKHGTEARKAMDEGEVIVPGTGDSVVTVIRHRI